MHFKKLKTLRCLHHTQKVKLDQLSHLRLTDLGQACPVNSTSITAKITDFAINFLTSTKSDMLNPLTFNEQVYLLFCAFYELPPHNKHCLFTHKMA